MINKTFVIPSHNSTAKMVSFTANKKYEAKESARKGYFIVKDDNGNECTVSTYRDHRKTAFLGENGFFVAIHKAYEFPEPSEALRRAEKVASDMFGFHTGGYLDHALTGCSKIENAKIGSGIISNVKMNADKFSFYGNGVVAAIEVGDLRTNEEKLIDEVQRLTGELAAAHATIGKIREALRTPAGDDVQAHAKVLRQMSDALVKLWRGE